MTHSFQQERIQIFHHFADITIWTCALVESVFPGVRAAISMAASVGGSGDL